VEMTVSAAVRGENLHKSYLREARGRLALHRRFRGCLRPAPTTCDGIHLSDFASD